MIIAENQMNVEWRNILFQGHGPNCNGTPLKSGVTEKEKEEILDIHNKWRSTIAQGKERRGSPGPQPGASDMKIMVRKLTWLYIYPSKS